ncbi:MAG: LamG domain-containing protein [Kiritimatiellae bacterium]|nr:LamG domain-containing protein [Kiritimatiellia bacterium]
MVIKRCFCALYALTISAAASAGVVGWWRFNGTGTNVPNVASPGVMDGAIVSVNNNNNTNVADFSEVSFGSDSSKYPTITSNLQAEAPRVYDPLDGSVKSGGKTLSYQKKLVQGGVMIPYDAALANLTTFTVEAIIRLPTDAGSRSGNFADSMFPIAQFGRDQTEGWIFSVYQGYLFSRFTYKNTSDSGYTQQQLPGHYYAASGFPSLYDGKWHHVAMVFTTSGSHAVCRMFVDGVQYAENRTQAWKSWNYTRNLPLFIGANPWSRGRTFYGDIAEVRITDNAVSKNQNNNFLVPLLDGQGLADNDTALLLTFDNATKFGFPTNMTIATKETAGTSDTHESKAYMWYAKNWNILNAAYNAPTLPTWLALATKGNANHLNVDLWPKMDDAMARQGDLLEYAAGGTTNAIVNSAVLDIPTESASGKGGSNAIKLDDAASYISTNSFTAECVFKTSIADGDTDTIFYTPFMKLCVYQGKLLLRGYSSSVNRNSIGDIVIDTKVNDGKWHHAACVYDASGGKSFTLYLDGRPGSYNKTGKTLCYGPHSDGNGFVIGAQYVSITADGAQGFKGAIDAVRITRRVLTTDEFLKSKTVERLMDARFDSDTPSSLSSGLPDYIAPSGTGATMSGGSSVPAIVRSRGGKVVYGDGEKAAFGSALKLDGNGAYAIWPRNRLLERRSFTLEFFGKFPTLANGVTFARLNMGSSLDAPVWALYNGIGDGQRRLTIAAALSTDGGFTGTRRDQALYNFTTHAGEWEGWHHWALTVAESGSSTVFTIYKDGVNSGSYTLSGTIYIPPEGTCFSFGGSIANGAYMSGTFDNIRISPGVLSPSQFMKYERGGMTVLVR